MRVFANLQLKTALSWTPPSLITLMLDGRYYSSVENFKIRAKYKLKIQVCSTCL